MNRCFRLVAILLCVLSETNSFSCQSEFGATIDVLKKGRPTRLLDRFLPLRLQFRAEPGKYYIFKTIRRHETLKPGKPSERTVVETLGVERRDYLNSFQGKNNVTKITVFDAQMPPYIRYNVQVGAAEYQWIESNQNWREQTVVPLKHKFVGGAHWVMTTEKIPSFFNTIFEKSHKLATNGTTYDDVIVIDEHTPDVHGPTSVLREERRRRYVYSRSDGLIADTISSTSKVEGSEWDFTQILHNNRFLVAVEDKLPEHFIGY